MIAVLKEKGIFTGAECNNNCIFCRYRHGGNAPKTQKNEGTTAGIKKEKGHERTTEEIQNELENAKKEGFGRVVFTGGNPLLREDLNGLLDYAHSLRFRSIGVETNGRDFFKARLVMVGGKMVYFDEAMKEAAEKLNYFRIKLCGANPEMHDSITGREGSFHETIAGIENINRTLSEKPAGYFIRIDVPVIRENLRGLEAVVRLGARMRAGGVRLLPQEGLDAAAAAPHIGRAVEAGLEEGILVEAGAGGMR